MGLRLLTLTIVAALIYLFFRPNYRTIRVGSRTWHVIADYDNSAEAAGLLADVHSDMLRFMKYLIDKYHIDEIPYVPPTDPDKYNIVRALVKNYNPDEFYENDPRYSSDTSYTKGKGSSMHICLRHKNNPTKLVDRDMLFFVVLHEMAHIGNYDDWGHKPRFWEIFKFFLKEAQAAGVYHPVNWAVNPEQYCGLRVAYNPLFDSTIADM